MGVSSFFDRIIYIDAEVVASFYAVFQLITFVGFSVDQSKDRKPPCVWNNVLKYTIVNNLTCQNYSRALSSEDVDLG